MNITTDGPVYIRKGWEDCTYVGSVDGRYDIYMDEHDLNSLPMAIQFGPKAGEYFWVSRQSIIYGRMINSNYEARFLDCLPLLRTALLL